ncbi:MAG: peptidoglycan-binding protein [Clostridia bacterium]|nr:peptidoglycan-binding protein [Clostridia bacterium]
MKKQFFFAALMILCILFTAAYADPIITDTEATAWIAENNYLYLQNAEGRISQMPLEMSDLLQMTKDELICQTKDGRTIAVKKDGTGSRNVDQTAELPQDTRVELSKEGVLKLDGATISKSALQAVSDGKFLYYTEKMGELYLLRVSAMQNDMEPLTIGSRDANAAQLTGRTIPEPLYVTVSREALVITTFDHRLIVINLNDGTTEEMASIGRDTLAGCKTNGAVYWYTRANDGSWVTESGIADEAAMKPEATNTPVPVETAKPTEAPKPTATPKTAEKKDKQESLIDDDGTVHYGARGSTVKKIQKRLSDLGYPVGSVDGKYGSDTQIAIELFCDAISVKSHNYITKKVQNKLFADDAPICIFDKYMPLKMGDKGANVRYMQKRLKDLGYDPGKVDGSYGKNTVAAVAKFQTAYNIAREANEKPGEVASRDMLITLYSDDTKPQIGTAASIDAGVSNFR